nr:hypothetical protein [Tanacetum cinerariifolium]
EVKNVVEQPAERRTRIIESLQNFRVIQISSVHAIAPILLTKEPEYSPSMGYEHLSTTPEMELDEVTESSAKNLLPILSECEVTSEDENNDDLTSSDDESLSEEDVPIEESKVYSNPLFEDDEIKSDELESHVESNFVESLSNHDSSQKINYLEEFSGELAHINPEITKSDFDFEEEIRLIENLLYDTSEEIDIVSDTNELLPLGFENDDSEGEVDVVEELHVDNSISNSKNELSANEESDFDNPSVPRPPSKPPDADFELDFRKEISVVMNDDDEFKCLDPRVEFDVSNDENDDYSYFMFVIYSKMFLSFFSAESEDTIFDPGISI